MGIIPDDDENAEIREQFQKPVTLKKFELEPIEEEIMSESEIEKPERNLNEAKKQGEYKSRLLQ
jgi:hypothetical protein